MQRSAFYTETCPRHANFFMKYMMSIQFHLFPFPGTHPRHRMARSTARERTAHRRPAAVSSHLVTVCTALVSPARRSAVNCGHLPPRRRRGRHGPLPLEERKADDAEDGVVLAPVSLWIVASCKNASGTFKMSWIRKT